MITLYDYFRSTASYRVRIALNIKGLAYTKQQIHLTENGGEQHSDAYQKINPQRLVPSLLIDDQVLTQSLPIIEYLEEKYPTPALLPRDPQHRALVRAMAQIIVSDVHPINNLRVLNYLQQNLHATEQEKNQWYHHWLRQGFDALETFVKRHSSFGKTCYKNQVTMADICLIPQMFNARRFEFSLNDYPNLCHVEEYCLSLESFKKAHPNYEK